MDNWRAAQEQGQGGDVGTPSAMDTRDWRNQLPGDSRKRIVTKIMDTLMRRLPASGQDGLQELKQIAIRFEEKIYTAATSQSEYLKRISMKMLTMENQKNGGNTGQNPLDQVHGMQTQVQNQQLSMPGQSQSRQQLMSQNMQGDIPAVQNSSSLTSTLPNSVSLTQSAMTNAMNQNSNLQNMQSMPNVAQDTTGNSVGPGMASNVFTNSQRLMSGRQHLVPQQQSQNTQTYLYQQQFQNQLVKQNFQQGGITHSLMQQQNSTQPNQMQTSQQGVMQSSPIQSSSIQQTQQPSVQPVTQPVLQPKSQSVLRQQHPQQHPTSLVHQQQSSTSQQTLPKVPQQQQQQQANATGIQHNQMIGQPNSIPDVKQQQQRLMGQQSNVPNLQQQQIMNQHNSLSNMQPRQMGPQGNSSGLHQQSVLGPQTGNAGMQTNQHNMHMLQQPNVPVQQHTQQNGTSLLPKQSQHSQQGSQQQMVSHIQSQPVPLQHLPQHSNTLLGEGQQRLPISGSLLQQQNIEQQKQLYQSQRVNPEASSNSSDSTAQTGNVNGGDWQEEVYQKIKSMKDRYFRDLNEMLMKISNKLQQHDLQPQQSNNGQLEKLRHFKLMLDRLVALLCTNRSEIQNYHRERWPTFEKQIVHILNSNRPRRTVPQMSERQPQAQLSHMPLQDNQMNPQMQPMNHHSSMTMQPNSLTNLQHSTPVSSSQQNMMSGVQPASTLELGQTNARNPLQQIAVTSLQANTIGSPQTVNSNSLSSQSGLNSLQSNLNNSLQTNSNLIQNQHIKQEHQTFPAQQLKQQMQQREINQVLARQQQQLMHQQPHHQHQQQSQQQQQVKQQHPSQLSGHQMSPLHQITDSGDVKVRQQIGVKPAVFQQPNGQRAAYHHQLKSGSPFPVSPPQVLQAHSPQIPPHHSPQIDQQNMLTTMVKAGTPLQSASSPFVSPSPSTPLAPSPIPGESEKLITSLSFLSNTGNMGHSQVSTVGTTAGLAIGTPGISASPLLAEFSSLDGAHVNASTAVSSKLIAIEQPLDRLIKAVKSITHSTLAESVRDISSVVSMVDRIAGSAPGNGSRASVGEDLVAMTKCRLQARNFFTQDGPSGTKRMRRSISAMPSSVASSVSSLHDIVKQLNGSDTFELESTATSSIRRSRIEQNHALIEEIGEINRQLIETVVEISNDDVDPTAAAAAVEGGAGIIVNCSFCAVAFSPNLKSQYASEQMSPIQPLRLLIPTSYPTSSPILLDKCPVAASKEYEYLSMKVKSKFSISLRTLSQPMSLSEMARTWDVCARAVVSEFAQQSGGGTFSSKYGSWESCLTTA